MHQWRRILRDYFLHSVHIHYGHYKGENPTMVDRFFMIILPAAHWNATLSARY